jgi:hypothetical protein
MAEMEELLKGVIGSFETEEGERFLQEFHLTTLFFCNKMNAYSQSE